MLCACPDIYQHEAKLSRPSTSPLLCTELVIATDSLTHPHHACLLEVNIATQSVPDNGQRWTKKEIFLILIIFQTELSNVCIIAGAGGPDYQPAGGGSAPQLRPLRPLHTEAEPGQLHLDRWEKVRLRSVSRNTKYPSQFPPRDQPQLPPCYRWRSPP